MVSKKAVGRFIFFQAEVSAGDFVWSLEGCIGAIVACFDDNGTLRAAVQVYEWVKDRCAFKT